MLAHAKAAGLNAGASTGAIRRHRNGLSIFASINGNVRSPMLSGNGIDTHLCLSGTSLCRFTSSRQHCARLTPIAASSNVEFLVSECQLGFGEGLKVVGSDTGIGAWDAASGLALVWGEGNNWSAATALTEGSAVEFKLVKTNADGETWEDGPNREIAVPEGGGKVVCQWNDPAATTLEEAPKAPKKAAAVSSPPKTKSKSKAPVVTEEVEAVAAPVAVVDSTPPPPPPPLAAAVPEPKVSEPVVAHQSDGASSLHPDLAKLASAVSHGSDGTMSITFGDAADTIDAATLASRLQ